MQKCVGDRHYYPRQFHFFVLFKINTIRSDTATYGSEA